MRKSIDCVCFSLNDFSEIHCEMAERMVISLRKKNKHIQIFCLYSGKNKIFLKRLELLNVIVIITKLTFESHVNNSRKLNESEKEIATGAYLMVDIPLHISNKRTALYVDCDVIFLDRFSISNVPSLDDNFSLGACSERNWEDSFLLNYFNTGFVVFDILKMQNSYDRFVSHIIDKDFDFIAYDQGAINEFYCNQIMALPDSYNYKPYWLRKIEFDKAKVLHFHGLKPVHMKRILFENDYRFLESHKDLIDIIEEWGSKGDLIKDIKFLIDIYDSNSC